MVAEMCFINLMLQGLDPWVDNEMAGEGPCTSLDVSMARARKSANR
jgi:hypothetical protein